MAEQATPTFKLVLVGDGGTGKVRKILGIRRARRRSLIIPLFGTRLVHDLFSVCGQKVQLTHLSLDNVRQAPFDRRVREEIHGYAGC